VNFVADESVDAPIVAGLRADGHDVLFVAEMKPGIKDDEVLATANSQKRTLVTSDKDFGELVFRLQRVHHGVILLRLSGLSMQSKVDTVRTAIKDHSSELINTFSVISPGALRIRRN
jgi:predicted nuclease of predicted toxin-antitoxin system